MRLGVRFKMARIGLTIIFLGVYMYYCGECAAEVKNVGCPLSVYKEEITDEAELKLALENLADDGIEWNCHEAMYFLYLQRDEIQNFLVVNAPTLDWQGQEAVLRILCEVPNFIPDEKFVRLIFERLHDQRELFLTAHHSTHYDFIEYLQIHSKKFADLLASQIYSDNVFVQWAVTHILAEADLFEQYRDRYTQKVIAQIITNFRSDNISYNATYTARICLLVGEPCLPALRKEMIEGDAQSKKLASLIREVIVNKSSRARGDINMIGSITSTYLRGSLCPLSRILIPRKPRFLKKEGSRV